MYFRLLTLLISRFRSNLVGGWPFHNRRRFASVNGGLGRCGLSGLIRGYPQ